MHRFHFLPLGVAVLVSNTAQMNQAAAPLFSRNHTYYHFFPPPQEQQEFILKLHHKWESDDCQFCSPVFIPFLVRSHNIRSHQTPASLLSLLNKFGGENMLPIDNSGDANILYLRSVLCKYANKLLRVGLAASSQQTRTHHLRSFGHLKGVQRQMVETWAWE